MNLTVDIENLSTYIIVIISACKYEINDKYLQSTL